MAGPNLRALFGGPPPAPVTPPPPVPLEESLGLPLDLAQILAQLGPLPTRLARTDDPETPPGVPEGVSIDPRQAALNGASPAIEQLLVGSDDVRGAQLRRESPAFKDDLLRGFLDPGSAETPAGIAATSLIEAVPGLNTAADIRDLKRGFTNGDPFLFALGAIGMVPVAGDLTKSALRQVKRLSDVPGLSATERTILAAEKRQLDAAKTSKKVEQVMERLPSAGTLSSAALAGQVKRGWYQQSAQALQETFGADTPRFVAMLASLSPQTSVAANLENSLRMWRNWTRAGRPTDEASIVKLLGDAVPGQGLAARNLDELLQIKKRAGTELGIKIGARSEAGLRRQLAERLTPDQLEQLSILPAWIPNTVRALQANDPADMVLSGPKVDSFMRNLLGNTEAVTLDTWMAKLGRVNQSLFGGQLNVAGKTGRGLTEGATPGKGGAYLAYSQRIRETADELGRLTGERWTPSEVQETIWSWAYALDNTVGGAGSAAKRGELRNMISQVTDADIAGVPDFSGLLNTGVNRGILEEAGLSAPALRSAAASAAGTGGALPRAATRAGAEAAATAGRAGPTPNLEDLIELARNIERHSQGDVALRAMGDLPQ